MNSMDYVASAEERGDIKGGERLVFVGPVAFREDCLRRVLRVATAYAKPPNEKESCFILLGNIEEVEKVPVYVVEDYAQLQGAATSQHMTFDVEDVKKIAAEAERDGLTIVGIIHTHPRGEAEASTLDKAAWLTLQQEMSKSIPFLIYSISHNEIGIVYAEQSFINQLNSILSPKKIKLTKKTHQLEKHT